jgi:rod shape-determining protein MreD
VVGPLQWIVYPALAAIAVTVLLATPLQVFGLHLPEPVIPMVLAFAWPLIRPSMTAPAVLFLVGLFLDLFWNAPLGLWALCLMAVYGTVLLSRNLLAGHEGLIRFGAYAGCTLGAFVLSYLVVTMRATNAPALWPLFLQITPTLLLFPIANWMLERFDDGDIRFR